MSFLKTVTEKIRFHFRLILFITVFSTNFFLVQVHFYGRYDTMLSSDSRGYFEYLPYTFVFHDVTHMFYAYTLENGNKFDKYPCGVAILEAPFFAVALLCDDSPIDKTVSYGKSYALSVGAAASFYLALAFVFLFMILRKLYNAGTAMVSLLLVYFCTNLFFYSTYEPGMSHVYSFFCFCGFLFFLDSWLVKRTSLQAILSAVLLALAIEVRPTNAIMAVMYLFYGVYSRADFAGRIRFLSANFKTILLCMLTGAMVFIPQLLYWQKTTGHLIFYSYGVNNESFVYWKSPKIFEALFGVQAGWLPYTPVMILFFTGLAMTIRKREYHGPSILIVFILILYCCASWWKYNFACAFGYRSFVEYYSLFIIPAGYHVFLAMENPRSIKAIFFFVLLLLFCYLNLIMSRGYAAGWPYCDDNFDWNGYFQCLSKAF